ncbi:MULTISPECIES: RNA-binding cell elongation regulator Jag/EloR [Alteribacter]|uniref:RNA-binding protein KhpB n=1 Tax=Alteribacter keqinensis TaxID=2483800 RepID=A0A3M7TTE5_9BACI|nr:RNA-binding cell elongation regulator Jag/EloR [Alteribacter keqinensis]MBM7095367.1 protein jag [Alteribacter salitolerans]RNA68022.1 protein jag [Alteribacter keqinensis]
MKKVTVSGKTVDEAIELAIEKLGVSREQADIRIIEEAQKGFLGIIGGKPAVVEAAVKPDPLKEALTFLRETIDKMGVTASVSHEVNKDTVSFNIEGEEIGILIGKRGQTLDSLQYLVNLVANKNSEQYLRIVLDAEGYRERRRESLEKLALRLGDKALRTGQEVRLEPMNALERKIIHTTLQNVKGVGTYSDGKEPNRRIVVTPK